MWRKKESKAFRSLLNKVVKVKIKDVDKKIPSFEMGRKYKKLEETSGGYDLWRRKRKYCI